MNEIYKIIFYNILLQEDVMMSKRKIYSFSVNSLFAQYIPKLRAELTAFLMLNSAFVKFSKKRSLHAEVLLGLNSASARFSQNKGIDIEAISRIHTTFVQFYQSYSIDTETISRLNSAFTQFSQTNNVDQEGIYAGKRLIKTHILYQVSDIQKYIDKTLPQLHSLDTTILKVAKEFDVSSVEINDDGSISYDGISYDSKKIDTALEKQMGIVKELTLQERFEGLKKQFWLLLFVLNIIMFLPQVSTTIEFYKEVFEEFQASLMEKQNICFTIKERSILREEASSKAVRIRCLPYDTKLEIVEDIPRWYQVKYIDETGVEIIGWISKISVELDK